MTISDTPGSLESDFTHNSRPIKIEFDRNMLIAMNLPVHVARQRIRESMPVNASLPMEEWTIDHWKERVRVTSFADVSYVDEDTTISTEGVEPHSVTYEQLAE